jgi:hypothetical protein
VAKMIKLRCKVPNTEAIESGSAKWRCRTSDPLWAGALAMGLRSLCYGVGVGRGKWRLHCWAGTPPRKIRARIQEHKHTSLNSLVGESSETRFSMAQKNDPRNGCRNA